MYACQYLNSRDLKKYIYPSLHIVSHIFIHVLLSLLFILFSSEAGTIYEVSTLRGKDARHEWERVFSTHYILPVLDNLSTLNVMELIIDNDQQGIALFYNITIVLSSSYMLLFI